MSKTITLTARPAYPGVAKGVAMCCPDSIQGWAGIDPQTGFILEKGHVHEGKSYDGKILVIPTSKGSCGWSGQFHGPMDNAGIRPAGWVVQQVDSKIGVTAVVIDRPMVTDFCGIDIFDCINDGDYVVVDGNAGTVTVTKAE